MDDGRISSQLYDRQGSEKRGGGVTETGCEGKECCVVLRTVPEGRHRRQGRSAGMDVQREG
jgi:hypothetical protein